MSDNKEIKNGDVLFEIEHLQKNFGDLQVLNDISTKIRKGEVVVIEESFGVRVTEIINN